MKISFLLLVAIVSLTSKSIPTTTTSFKGTYHNTLEKRGFSTDYTKEYKPGYSKVLGDGLWGQVSVVKHIHSGGIYALKEPIIRSSTESVILSQFIYEWQMMNLFNQLHMGHVIRPVDFYIEEQPVFMLDSGEAVQAPPKIGLVTELLGKELHGQVISNMVDPQIILAVLLDLAKGLLEFHERGFCHGDVKATNVLLNRVDISTMDKIKFSQRTGEPRFDPIIKYCDVGYSRLDILPHGVQIPPFIAQFEYNFSVDLLSYIRVNDGRLCSHSDIWNFGIMMGWVVLKRYPKTDIININPTTSGDDKPSDAEDHVLAVEKEAKKTNNYNVDVDNLPSDLPKVYKDILVGCLKGDPRERIFISQVVDMLISYQKEMESTSS